MKIVFAVILFSLIFNSAVFAVISEGDKAPDFTAQFATGSQQAPLSLSSLLAHGPVVLYFLSSPEAQQCSGALRALADSTAEFSEFHTSIVGVVTTSDQESDFGELTNCGGKLAIVPDPEHSISKSYDIANTDLHNTYAASVVISPENDVIHAQVSGDVNDLINQSLEAVQDWSQLVDQEY